MRLKTAAAALVLLLFGGSCAEIVFSAPISSGSRATTGSGPKPPGTLLNAGWGGFGAKGKHPVHFEAAEVLGVPKDMELVGIRALNIRNGKGVGGLDGDLTLTRGYEFRPVSDIVLIPNKPELEEWQLVITVRGFKPGDYKTKGIRVWWRAGRRSGTTDLTYYVELNVRECSDVPPEIAEEYCPKS